MKDVNNEFFLYISFSELHFESVNLMTMLQLCECKFVNLILIKMKVNFK